MGTYINYLKKFEKPIKNKGLTITVAGFSGSGKSTIAEAIARHFKLKVFNAGDIQRRFARKKKINLATASEVKPEELDYQMDKALLNLAMKGGCVLLGRLSAWAAGDWADCRIFVDSEKKIRVKRVALRDKLTMKDALIKVNKRDNTDIKRYRDLYGINVNIKKVYNFIIKNNKDGITLIKKETVRKIKDFFKNKRS